ncbi:hypothetical protein [Ferruginibacter sp. SUN106]|uniref:hypothetical protein n=1 Tax=Ferruginibacter sp. SUN106 TaxID=2978348 RepID=UPI003D35CB41
MEQNEKFSDDPQENFRIENEILKIKLKAQYGDAFLMQSNEGLPPEIENQFLKNIIAFEDAHVNAELTTVYEGIGKPTYKTVEELDTTAITKELKRILTIMEEHGINLDINDGPYDDSIIYKFITEELFAHEIDKTPVFGGSWNFIYEEFHPNDKVEIERNTHQFLGHWFSRHFDDYSGELGNELITADGRILSYKELLQKLQPFFESFTDFKDGGYNIDEIKFELQDGGRALGHAEGMLKYDAVMENRETIHYEGPYKLYMQREDKWWTIFYFVMPGFEW